MQGLTYLKHCKKESYWGKYITITLIAFLGSLLLYAWGYGSGLREGYKRADASMTKAMQGGYDIGMEKGLGALEEKRK